MRSDQQRRRFRFPWRTETTIARDVDDEIGFHVDMRAAELIAGGMSAEQAQREALREFGDVEYTRRYCRAVDARAERDDRQGEWRDELRQHVVLAARGLRRSPAFAAIALLTLALGIGANTAIFSVVRGVLLRPLPYADPDRLVAVYENKMPEHDERSDMSAADVRDYRAGERSFAALAAFTSSGRTYAPASGDPEVLQAVYGSANFFRVLGVAPSLGRTFAPDEDTPEKKRVVVLSDAAWRRVFGADSAIVGRSIALDGQPFTVIGVMPRGFTVGLNEDIWTPLDLSRALADPNRARKRHFLFGLGRLAPGVSLAAARSDLLAIARRLEKEYPEANTGHLVTVLPLRTALVGDRRATMAILMGAALLVLLIACANMANVVLSRTLARHREFAIRTALGAGRARLVRQVLTESVLLALLGGALGAAVAWKGTALLLALNPSSLPPIAHVGMDGQVLLVTALLALGSGVLFGLLPALGGSRDVQTSLKDAGRGSAGTRRSTVRSLLVVAQTALAVMLLVGAGLLVHSLREVQRVAMGFDPDRVLTAQLSVSGARYDSLTAINRFFDDVGARLRAMPGIVSVGGVGGLPLQGSATSSLTIENVATPPGHLPEVGYVVTDGEYFPTLRIPLVRGRFFDGRDGPESGRVTVVNRSLVRRFFPDVDPIGRRIKLGPNPASPWITIVGIVGDVRQLGLESEPRATAFVPNRQDGWNGLTMVIRTTGDPMLAAPLLRTVVREIDRQIPVTAVRTMDDVAGESVAARRFSMLLLSIFAVVALALAAVGIYGVLAYSVAARRREFGVRMAVGASARDVLSLVLREGLGWTLAGLALGVAGALATGRLLAGLLYGVPATDGATYGAVGMLVAIVALVACAVPARRATRVDPVVALREE